MVAACVLGIAASGSIVVVGFTFGTALAMFGVSSDWSAVKGLWKGTEYLSPLFFFLAGDSARVTHPGADALLSFLAVIVGVVVSRLIVVFVGRRAASDWIIFAASLLPRGEVTLVVLLAGIGAGIVTQATYLGGVGAVLVTSIVSPIILSIRQSSFHEE
jgi:Kef-type K+ transport system membrane component KefB